MPKILILDANCAAGIESIQTLGRLGAKVHASSPSMDCLAFRSKYCAEKLHQPSVRSEILEWLVRLDQTERYDLIVPATEVSLGVFLDPDCDNDLRRRAVLPSRESLAFAINKESVLQRAKELSIPVPPSVLASNGNVPALPYSYPVAIKPVHSKQVREGKIVDRRVTYAQNEVELREILAAVPESSFQIQQLVRGHGVGIELLFVHGEPIWSFAHRRVHELPLTGGGSSYRCSIEPAAELLQNSIALLRSLAWHGVAMVEWKVDDDGSAYFIEINPRLWGSIALAIDAGVDFPRALLSVAQGRMPGPQPSYKVGRYTRDIARDLDWQIANFRADHNNPQLLTRSRVRSLLELLRPLTISESWDYFDVFDLNVIYRSLRSYFQAKVSAATGKIAKRYRSWQFVKFTHTHVMQRLAASPEATRNILFLCYGNICRSPLAELIAHDSLRGYNVGSAGFHKTVDRQSPDHMKRAALKLNVDMNSHRSRRVTKQDVDRADLILVMDWKNYVQLSRTFPEAKAKATFLGLFGSMPRIEIDDPYELTGEGVDQIVEQIKRSTDGLGDALAYVEGALQQTSKITR
jgi:protein-tyrosine-phosphatase